MLTQNYLKIFEIIKTKVDLKWTIQNIAPSTMSTNLVWKGPISLGPKIVSVLSKWPKIRLEIIQENTEKKKKRCKNTSIKNNYISAVTTCKIIIKSLKSI